MHRRWLIPFATTFLLWSVVVQLNHYLAPVGAYLFVGGLLVAFAALRLSLRNGLTATLLLGLCIDAAEPVPFGTHLLLFAVMHIIIYHLRTRLPREETVIGVVVALLANLALVSGLSFVTFGNHPAAGAAWLRIFADLGWSQLFIVAIAPWFFALQERALELGRVDLAEESHRPF